MLLCGSANSAEREAGLLIWFESGRRREETVFFSWSTRLTWCNFWLQKMKFKHEISAKLSVRDLRKCGIVQFELCESYKAWHRSVLSMRGFAEMWHRSV